MAELTAARNNALPYPVYGVPWVVGFPLLDADGDPISPSAPDSEVSKNLDTYADCTNEAVEIATTSGSCYLILTGAEMTADVVMVQVKSTGAKTTILSFYPRKLVSIRAGTSQTGAAGTITLDSGASAIDDYYNGCLIVAVIDTLTEARIITDYVGSTKVASVTPNWNVTPDVDDTFTIYLPEGRQVGQADNVAFNGVATTSSAGRPEVNTTHAAGTAWASGAITAASIATDAITAAKIAADAITAAKVADGTIDAATFATGAINAAAIAADAITAAKVAADVSAEIADAVWDEDATGHQTQGTFGQAIGDPVADTNTIFKATVTDATGVTVGADTAALLTAVDALPTNAELATALAAADDAVLAAIAALNNLSAAQVNAEVVDALATDTYAEPGQGTPSPTLSLANKIGYLLKAWRNRHTQTADEYALYADGGTTKDQEAVVSDNGTTFERGEISTGA